MIRVIKNLIQEKRRQRDLRNIREGFAFFGLPLLDMSDDELSEKIYEASQAFCRFGISVAEATENLRALNASFPSQERTYKE